MKLNHCLIYLSLPIVFLSLQLFDCQRPIAGGCLLLLWIHLSDGATMCVLL